MPAPLTTSEYLTAILAAIRGVNTVVVDPADPDPTTSPTGTSTVSNWRSRTSSPNIDNATGKRSWLVPVGREWQLMGLSGTLQTSATTGNRQAEVFCNPGENNVIVFRHRYPAASQPASLTYIYNFAMGNPLLMSPLNGVLLAPLPPLILAPASTIVLWDKAQIAPATDVWSNVNLVVLERVIA